MAVPVRHPQVDEELWLVVSRPGKSRRPKLAIHALAVSQAIIFNPGSVASAARTNLTASAATSARKPKVRRHHISSVPWYCNSNQRRR